MPPGCEQGTHEFLLPKGDVKLAQCFSFGFVSAARGASSEGTAEKVGWISTVPSGLVDLFSRANPTLKGWAILGSSLRDENAIPRRMKVLLFRGCAGGKRPTGFFDILFAIGVSTREFVQ